jgi:hypothetical protein
MRPTPDAGPGETSSAAFRCSGHSPFRIDWQVIAEGVSRCDLLAPLAVTSMAPRAHDARAQQGMQFHISNVQRRSLPGEHGIVPAKWLKSGRGQQLGRPAVECLCDLQEIQHGDITLAPFDLAHVASVNLSNVSQGFLRDIEILPASANGASDRLQVFLSVALAATV